MDPDYTITALTSAVIFLATVVHSIGGFGFAQVSMGLLPVFRDPANASIIYTLAAVVCNAVVFYSVKNHFRLKDWYAPAAGLLIGLPIGIFFFQNLDPAGLKSAIYAIIPIALGLALVTNKTNYLQEKLRNSRITAGWKPAATAGFCSGVLGGAVAITTPPMLIYGALKTASGKWTADRLKALLTSLSGSLMSLRFGALIFTGSVTSNLVIEALLVLPALAIGTILGAKIFYFLKNEPVKKVQQYIQPVISLE